MICAQSASRPSPFSEENSTQAVPGATAGERMSCAAASLSAVFPSLSH